MAQIEHASLASAKDAIAGLVKRFERNVDQYRRSGYNETQARVDYIDPFFEALGWDVHNHAGYSEAYRDVAHEESLRLAAGIEAPGRTFPKTQR